MKREWDYFLVVLAVCAVGVLMVLWVQVPSDGQPFHQPGQSDRSVIFEPDVPVGDTGWGG